MPKHKQDSCYKPNTCGGTCEACTLAVCSVCGAYEGGLTTDCPGISLKPDTWDKVYAGELDYTDERSWFTPNLEKDYPSTDPKITSYHKFLFRGTNFEKEE